MAGDTLDPVIHAPLRLQVCAVLIASEETEFATLRQVTGVSDSVLSKHLRQLEEAGYVLSRKALIASRHRTWLALTPAGRRAFAAHVRALNALAALAAAAD
jgi:DNA-binding MarR family transcriptional regulator